jgi:hypothetical protein
MFGYGLRFVLNPTAVPKVMGRRMEPGRLLNTASGRVREGM